MRKTQASQKQNQHSQQSNIAALGKQESLYVELQNVENEQQSQQKQDENMNTDVLISVDDNSEIPVLNLQLSPRYYKPLSIKILSYRTSAFMGITTQIFTIKVSDPSTGPPAEYEIQRRFSDFSDFYYQLFFNQPGYILHPFPDKTLESFIKMKLSLQSEPNSKQVMVEKRMKELEDFVDWVARHKKLCNSEQFAAFLAPSQKKFEEEKARLNKYVEENKSLLAGSHLKSIVEIGKSMFNSYFKNGPIEEGPNCQNEEEKEIAFACDFIRKQKQKLSQLVRVVELLMKAEKQFSQFTGMDTQIDVLLKTCAKHDSGRQYCGKLVEFLDNVFISRLGFLLLRLEESQKSIMHHYELLDKIATAKQQLDLEKKAKLERMLQRIRNNFAFDWLPFTYQHQETYKILVDQFKEEWEEHKLRMRKIWK